MSATEEAEYATWTASHFADRVETIAAGLRRLADQFEREAKVRDGNHPIGGEGRFANAAEAGLHAITWGIANLHTDGLVRAASMADLAEAKVAPSSGA